MLSPEETSRFLPITAAGLTVKEPKETRPDAEATERRVRRETACLGIHEDALRARDPCFRFMPAIDST